MLKNQTLLELELVLQMEPGRGIQKGQEQVPQMEQGRETQMERVLAHRTQRLEQERGHQKREQELMHQKVLPLEQELEHQTPQTHLKNLRSLHHGCPGCSPQISTPQMIYLRMLA